MKKFAFALGVAAAAICASSASAGTYVDPWTSSATGVSVVFGNSGFATAGAESIPGETVSTSAYDAGTGVFTDTFDFYLPTGIVGFTLSSIGFTEASSLGSILISFNGTNIPVTLATNGDGASFSLTTGAFGITSGGQQQLVITGTAGSAAVYSGTATFETASAVVPEPGSWALMIAGFGGAGAMIRRRRERVSFVGA